MPDLAYDIIKVAAGGILGGLITFLRMRWKLRQDRKTEWAKMRVPIYNESLEFVYEVEQNQHSHENLSDIRTRWIQWFSSKGNGFPPSVHEAVLIAINYTAAIIVDLSNKDFDREIRNTFRESLQTAKQYLLDKKDIGWLPEDLR